TRRSSDLLADTAGVNKIFFAKFDVNLFLLSAAGALVPNKSALDMGVTKETNGGGLISEAGGGIEIAKDVAPLRWSIEGGVNDGEIAYLPLEAQIAQPFAIFLAQLRPRPSHRALCHFIEITGSFRL